MAEDKFHHLLQPLRDLAANWNINIANELGEYLEVLEGITFSFQKGQSLNFAEAALLIQGSACVYSKKVEYLHSLVYQALEFVTDRKVKALRSKGTAAEAPDDNEFDDEEHFLCLDDSLEEGTGLDLLEDDYDTGGDGYMDEVLLTRLPATLLALEDTGMGDGGDGEAGNYSLASCAVHHSGALLLEARDGYMLDEHLRPIHSSAAFGWATTASTAAAVENFQFDAVGAAQNGDDVDYGNDDTGDYFHDDDYQMDANNSSWEAPAAATEGMPTATVLAPAEEEDDEEEEFDPYKPLDPGNASGITVKPFKKMSRIAKKPRMRAALQEAPTHILTGGVMTMPAPATGLLFPEFNYALITQQEKEKSVKKSKRARQQLASVFTLADAEVLAATTALEEAEMNEDDGNNANNADDNGYFDDHFDDMGCEVDDFEDIVAAAEAARPAVGGLLVDIYNNAPIGVNDDGGGDISYEDLCRAYVESLISAAAATAVQTELSSRVTTWRSKMEPVLEEEDARPDFDIHVYGSRILQGMAGLSVSEKCVHEEEEGEVEEEEEIDVDNEVSAIHFDQVVTASHTENGYDVPRVFSSMLQLVNNGNLRITKIRDCSDNFSIQLLSTELKHQRIDDYRAPSTIEAVEGINNDDNTMNEEEEPGRKNGNGGGVGGRRGRTAVGAENQNEKKAVAATAPKASKRRKA